MNNFVVPFLLLSFFKVSCLEFIDGDILFRKEIETETNFNIAGGVKLADPSKLWPGGYVYYRYIKYEH